MLEDSFWARKLATHYKKENKACAYVVYLTCCVNCLLHIVHFLAFSIIPITIITIQGWWTWLFYLHFYWHHHHHHFIIISSIRIIISGCLYNLSYAKIGPVSMPLHLKFLAPHLLFTLFTAIYLLFLVSLLLVSMDRRCRNVRMRWMGLSHPLADGLCGYAKGRRSCLVLAALAVPLPVMLKRRSSPPSPRAAAPSPCPCCAASCAS